jgi:glutathione S-transferase
MQVKLSRLEDAITGPFFAGEDFRLIDAAAAPLLQRLAWCDEAAKLSLFSEFPKIAAWWETLAAHPSVRRSTVDAGQAKFLTLLEAYGSWVGSVAGGGL